MSWFKHTGVTIMSNRAWLGFGCLMGPTVFGYLAAYVTHNYTWLWLDLPFALLVLAGLFFMIAGEVEENRKIEKDRRA